MSTDTEPTDRERANWRCTYPCNECGDKGSVCDGPEGHPGDGHLCGDCNDSTVYRLEAALKLSEARNAILREALEQIADGSPGDCGSVRCKVSKIHPDCFAARALSQAAALGTAETPDKLSRV